MRLRSSGSMISVMDRIFKQRTYEVAIRYTSKAGGRVSWNGKDVLIDDRRFSLDDIRTVVHGLHETARRRLHEELLFVAWDAMPPVQMVTLAENPVEMSKGWSFLADTRHEFPVNGRRRMWRRLFEAGVVQSRFISGNIAGVADCGTISWKVESTARPKVSTGFGPPIAFAG